VGSEYTCEELMFMINRYRQNEVKALGINQHLLPHSNLAPSTSFSGNHSGGTNAPPLPASPQRQK
jgi:hypothetical protein